MVQIKIFAICLASVFVLNFVNCAANEFSVDIANVEFTTVPNITQFLRANPEFKLIQTLAKVQNPQKNYQIKYTLGKRVDGDKLVARSAEQWQYPQDITSTLTYPATGTGSIVSYVEIIVEQSSDVGRAYLVSGGIGQRAIKIIVEAEGTLFFRSVSEIYGL